MLIIQEHQSDKYTPRTYYNAKSADLTLAVALDLNTPGEKCTQKAASPHYLGVKINTQSVPIEVARLWYKAIKQEKAHSINIAGNGIYTLSKSGISQEWMNRFIYEALSKVFEHHPIQKIYTGGQTGVDLAGAVAGYCLNIDTEVTLPKGFIQRFEDKQDVSGTQDGIMKQILMGAKQLTTSLKLAEKSTPNPLPKKQMR